MYIRITLLFLLQISATYAQEANFNGARNESLAIATIALQSPWSLFTNPSGMEYHNISIVMGYQNKYIELGIQDGAFGFLFPIKNAAVGLGVSYFGDELLNKVKAVTSIAHKIGKVSLGLKTSYEQWSIKELGSRGILYADLGGQMEVTDKLIVGMGLINLSQAKFDTLTINSPVTAIKAGISFHPHNKLALLAQIEKDISNPFILKLGAEYFLTPMLAIRTGVLPTPATGYTGIGLVWPHFHLDLAGSYQQELGWSGCFSINVPLTFSDENKI